MPPRSRPAGINGTVVHLGYAVTERMPGLIAGYAARHGLSEGEAVAALTNGHRRS